MATANISRPALCRLRYGLLRRFSAPVVPAVLGSSSRGKAYRQLSSYSLDSSDTADVVSEVSGRHSPSPPLYPGHRPTRLLERAVLTLGSGAAALLDQKRGDMVAVFGETSGHFALQRLKHKMMASREGRRILRFETHAVQFSNSKPFTEPGLQSRALQPLPPPYSHRDRPRITSETIQFESLLGYPEGTLGRVYADFMTANRISPDSRLAVRYVDDPDLAYVMQRYRETHDFLHTLLDQKTNLYGEIVVKWFEAVQTELPMCALGAMGALFKLPARKRRLLGKKVIPKIVGIAMESELVLNYSFEDHLGDSLSSVKAALNLPQDTLDLLQGRAS